MNIYEKVRKKCKENGIAVSTLEKELGWSNGSIGRWSKTSPSIDKVILVSEKLQITLNELLEISGRECERETIREEISVAEKILDLSKKRRIVWREEENSERCLDIIRDINCNYRIDEKIFTAIWRNGMIYLVIHMEDMKVGQEAHIELYLSVDEGRAEKEKADSRILYKILQFANEELYNRINHMKLAKYREELLTC